jgi:hypothetical protein
MKRLIAIQQELKAPKWQTNDFGHYKYRSCEDIVEAVKPLLAKQKLSLVMKDNMVQVWERYYIEALVELYDEEWKLVAYSTWYAREEESKKWMDWSQITWSSSSYARKYALCWLLAIDDWVDSDLTNKWSSEVKEKKDITTEWPFTPNNLPWFNKEEFELLKWNVDWVKSYDTSDSLLSAISTKYRLSKSMKQEVADFRASL